MTIDHGTANKSLIVCQRVCTSVKSSGHTFSSPLGFGRGIFENSPLLSLNNMILYALSRWRPTQLGEGKKIKFTRYHIIKMCMNIMPLSDNCFMHILFYMRPHACLINGGQKSTATHWKVDTLAKAKARLKIRWAFAGAHLIMTSSIKRLSKSACVSAMWLVSLPGLARRPIKYLEVDLMERSLMDSRYEHQRRGDAKDV